jgi:hypothetical protein
MAVEFAVPIPDDGVVVTVDPRTLVQQVRAWPTASNADHGDGLYSRKQQRCTPAARARAPRLEDLRA